MSTFVNFSRRSVPDFFLAGDQVFVKGKGLFDINDPKLHEVYPNFTKIKKMIKEIENNMERQELIDALYDFDQARLLKMSEGLIEGHEKLDREGLIEALSQLTFKQLKKAINSLSSL